MQTVNGREEAVAALRAGEIHLQSPDCAACHAGVNYYAALLHSLRAEFPETPFSFTLCCGDDAAIAHDALRIGFTSVRLRTSDAVFIELSGAAKQMGATLLRG